jgi:paraquat-inducible protein B
MSKQANKTAIGVFVVSAIALAAIGTIVFGGGKFFVDKNKIVMFFDASVKGLNIGAPIVFRGVNIGQVTSVLLEARPKDLKIRIPVYGETYSGRFRLWGEEDVFEVVDTEVEMQRLIEKGLRAQLQMQSLVTGLLQINIDFFPDEESRFVQTKKEAGVWEIPTVPSETEKIRNALAEIPIQDMFTKLSRVLDGIDRTINNPEIGEIVHDVKLAVSDARTLLQESNRWVGTVGSDAHQTFGDIQGLVRNTDSQIEPLAENANSAIVAARGAFRQGEKTLAFKEGKAAKMVDSLVGATDEFRDAMAAVKPAIVKAEAAMENIRSITKANSEERYQINTMLKELSAAARSIRIWASYLERHPEALITGKGGPKGRK